MDLWMKAEDRWMRAPVQAAPATFRGVAPRGADIRPKASHTFPAASAARMGKPAALSEKAA
jgi:hypothetical protein